MRYLIDIHASPPVVVLVHDSIDHMDEVAERYANQVQRPLIIAIGPAPADAQVRPYVPKLAPTPPPSQDGVGAVEGVVPTATSLEESLRRVAASGEAEHTTVRPHSPVGVVSYDPERITADQRAALAALGITL